MKLSLFLILVVATMAYAVPVPEANAVEQPEGPEPGRDLEAAPEDDLKTDATIWGGFYRPYYSGWNPGYYRPRYYNNGWNGYGGYGGYGRGWNHGYGYWG